MKKLFALMIAILSLSTIGFAQSRTDLSNVYQKLRQDDRNYFRAYKPTYNVPAANSYSNSNNNSSNSGSTSSSSTHSSSTNNKGTLVARVSAFGVYSAFGNTTTTTQTLEVYSEGGNYFIWDHKLYGDVKVFLIRNSRSTYMGYSVGQYNYSAGPWSINDITWFIKL